MASIELSLTHLPSSCGYLLDAYELLKQLLFQVAQTQILLVTPRPIHSILMMFTLQSLRSLPSYISWSKEPNFQTRTQGRISVACLQATCLDVTLAR